MAPDDSVSASPAKRVKLSPADAVVSAAYKLLVSEPSILQTIASFIPPEPITRPPREEDDDDDDDDDIWAENFDTDSAFETIVTLCRTFPALAQRLGPENQDFWRAMVLRRFDFTVDPSRAFNVGEVCEDAYIHDSYLNYGTPKFPDGIREAILRYEAARCGAYRLLMLEHDLVFWPAIGAFFRPAEYDFLSKIQHENASISTWPDREDAFTLYCDLALLQDKLSKFENLQTWSDGDQLVLPCLLSRPDSEINDDSVAMLKHCGFIPHFWLARIHPRWSGFNEPLPPPAATNKKDDYLDVFDERTEEEKRIFPLTCYDRRCFESFRRVVHESFSDWRRVHANDDDDDGPSPEFYVGRRKVSGRWLGYVGESQFCEMPPP